MCCKVDNLYLTMCHKPKIHDFDENLVKMCIFKYEIPFATKRYFV